MAKSDSTNDPEGEVEDQDSGVTPKPPRRNPFRQPIEWKSAEKGRKGKSGSATEGSTSEEGVGDEGSEILRRLDALEEKLDRLAEHLGADRRT